MLQMQEGSLFQHSFLSLVRDSFTSNGSECMLLTRLGFWVDVFVGHPPLPVYSDCSELPAQNEAIWSFILSPLPLLKPNIHLSQLNLESNIIKIFPSTRQMSYENLNLVFHVLMDGFSFFKKGVSLCCHLLC